MVWPLFRMFTSLSRSHRVTLSDGAPFSLTAPQMSIGDPSVPLEHVADQYEGPVAVHWSYDHSPWPLLPCVSTAK